MVEPFLASTATVYGGLPPNTKNPIGSARPEAETPSGLTGFTVRLTLMWKYAMVWSVALSRKNTLRVSSRVMPPSALMVARYPLAVVGCSTMLSPASVFPATYGGLPPRIWTVTDPPGESCMLAGST